MPDKLFNELKAKYEQYLAEDFKNLLKTRRLIGWSIGGFFAFFFIFMILSFVMDAQVFAIILSMGFIVPIASVVVLIVTIVKGNKKEDNYHTKYYETVIKDLISSMYTDVKLALKDEYNFRNIFHESGFYRGYDRQHIRSEWAMRYGSHNLYLYDVVLENESTDSDGNTTYTTVFAGLFGFIDLSQSLNDDIYVNKTGGIANKGTERVNIDSVVFSKQYKVYATNKVKAMQLLTHDVMDKILEYSEQYKTKFEFRILNNKLFFRIFNHNTFTNNSKEAINRAELENDYHNLTLFKDITDIVEASAYSNGLFS